MIHSNKKLFIYNTKLARLQGATRRATCHGRFCLSKKIIRLLLKRVTSVLIFFLLLVSYLIYW